REARRWRSFAALRTANYGSTLRALRRSLRPHKDDAATGTAAGALVFQRNCRWSGVDLDAGEIVRARQVVQVRRRW
ncbi:MAG: hypothetical protein ABI969_16350, partial [bacterium]